MGEAYRGLTIQFKADGTKVLSTMRSMTRAASQVEDELRMVQKGLKFNPASMKLAQSQMNLLGEKAKALGAEVIGLQRHMRELGKVKFDGVEMRELSARTKDASTAASLLKARYASVTEALAETRNGVHAVWQQSRLLSTMANPFDNKRTKATTSDLQSLVTLMRRFGVISGKSADEATASLMRLRAEYRKLGAAWASSEKLAKEKNPFVNAESLSTKQIDQFIARMQKAGAITSSEADRMKASVAQLRGAMSQISEKYTWSNFSTGQIQKLIGVMERFGAISTEEANKAKAAVAGLRAEFAKAGSQYEKFSHIAEYQSMGNKIELEAAKMKAAIREMNEAARTLRPTGFEDSLARVSTFYRSMTGQVSRLKSAMKLDPGNYDLIAAHANAARGKVEALKIENRELRAEMGKLGETAGVEALAKDLGKLVAGIHASDASLEQANSNFVEMGAKVNDAKERLQELVIQLHKAGMSGREIKLDERFRQANQELKNMRAELIAADAAQQKAAQSAQTYAKAMKYAENANRIAANEAEIAASQGNGFKKIKLNAEEVKADAETIKNAIKEANAAMRTLRPTGFEDSIERARTKVRELDAQAKELKAAMKLDPKSFALVAAHADTVKGKVEALKVENRELRAEMDELGKSGRVRELAADYSKLVSEMSRNDAAVNRVNSRFVETEEKVRQARLELRKTAVELHNMGKKGSEIRLDATFQEGVAELKQYQAELRQAGAEQDRLTAKSKEYAAAVRLGANANKIAANEATIAAIRQQQSQTKKMKLLSSSAATALGMTMYSTLYPAVMMAGTYAIQAAEDVDAAYRNMRKTVQGTDQEFEQLKKNAMEFGDTHYTAADQLLQIEAIGGQLGITVDNLEAFSKTIANLNIATNVDDAEELATQFGKMASVMGLSSEEYDRFADSLVRLGNSEPAMESDILNMTTRFMGMGKVVGMSADQMLAWATAAVATGQKAEAAGSSMLRMTGRFEAAVAGAVPEEFLSMEDLTDEDLEALQTAQDKLQGYADVARMTADEFASLWERDPSKALQSFVEGLHQMEKEGDSAVQALKDLGINNVRDQQLFLGLANTTDVLSDSLVMSANAWNGVSDEWGDAGDAQREADKKMQGFSGTLQIMKNNGQHLASVMGESLTPTLKSITDIIAGLVGAFADLDPSIQQAITLSVLGSAALGPLLTAYGAMSNAVKNAKTSMKEYTSAENKIARLENSRIARMTGLSDRYKRWTKDVDKARATIERCNAAANKPSVMTSPKAMAQVNKGWREANATLAATKLKMGALTKIQAVGSLFGSVGSMAAIGALMVGLEQVGTYLYDVHQKSEQYKQSTEGLSNATTKLKIASKNAGTDIGLLSASMEDATYQHGQYFSKVQEVIKANAELAQTVQDRVNGAFSDSASAEFYAEKIAELAGNCQGSVEQLSALKAYIDEYNQLTGSNIQIVDDFTGAVNLSTEALEKQKEAFIQMTLAEAYRDVLKDAAAQVAKTEMEIEKMDQSLADVYKEAEKYGYNKDEFLALANPDMGGLTELDPGYWEAMSQYYSTLPPEVAALIDKNKELLQSQQELEKQLEGEKELRDAAANSYTEQIDKANEATKAAEEEAKKQASISAINDALHNNKLQDDVDFEPMANELGYFDEGVQQLCNDLAEVGIGSKELGKIGTTAFMQLWQKATDAGGGIEEVAKAVHLVNATGIEPKDLVIEDGSITIAKEALTDLDRQELTEKGYTVNDDGTVTVAIEEVDRLKEDLNALDGMHATPTAALNDELSADVDNAKKKMKSLMSGAAKLSISAAFGVNTNDVDKATNDVNSKLSGIKPADVDIKANDLASGPIDTVSSKLTNLDGDTATVTVYENTVKTTTYRTVKEPGSATGGVSRVPLNIPRNASGGLSGIATRAIMTNQGWVGENGSEALIPMGHKNAIVPLSNRRYVRPFARAVAAEMNGSNGGTQVVNKYYSVGNVSFPEGSDGARALEALYDALRVEEAV